MNVGIIVTNNGEHSPEKLALACAEKLMEIDPAMMDGDRVMAALKLKMDVMEALMPHMKNAAAQTKAEIHNDAKAHFSRADLHDPGERLNEVVSHIKEAAQGTPWQDQFNSRESDAIMRSVVGQFLVDTAHLERLYHADRNPDDEHAAAYKAAPTGIAVLPMAQG